MLIPPLPCCSPACLKHCPQAPRGYLGCWGGGEGALTALGTASACTGHENKAGAVSPEGEGPRGLTPHPSLSRLARPEGTPVNRIPIMAKQVLDLYTLYRLVTDKGGLVEVINKKIWREITKGLNLPTSITSAAFTLRTQ